jgi:hypothetical protein
MLKSVASEAKVITGHSAIYGLSNVLDRMVGFLMLPVHTRFFPPSDYANLFEIVLLTRGILLPIVYA